MRSAITGQMVEVDVVDGKIVEFPDRVRCPDCGEIVPDVFAHVTGCTNPFCFKCGQVETDRDDGLCRDCHMAEHGPAWEPGDSAGEPAFIRQNIIDSGRSHLL